MHTSTRLQASDFRYRRIEGEEGSPADFASLFPDYHELDRAGVVSLALEDGVLRAGAMLLALTTAFYDAQRAKGEPFYNYPQHFALFGGSGGQLQARGGPVPMSPGAVSPAWGNLDVWPESNWHLAPATAEGMLRKVFDLQVNRLFWPEGFLPRDPADRLPSYVRRILRSRLKGIYYYDSLSPTLEVEGSPEVARLLQRSRGALSGPEAAPEVGRSEPMRSVGGRARTGGVPDSEAGTHTGSAGASPSQYHAAPGVERFREVPAAAFLAAMEACFVDG